MPGWISTNALATGGTGHDQLSIVNAQIADGTITAAKMAAGAPTAGTYDVSEYDQGASYA